MNKLSLNISKTHYIIFTRQKSITPDLNIHVKDIPIDRVKHTKFLGVQIDEKLGWKPHIECVKNNYLKL